MKGDQLSDAERMERFVELLGQHERSLLTYLFALVTDWNLAEDLAQETRLRLWRQFDTYDPSKDFGAWARTIAYYQVLQHRTLASREPLRFRDDILAGIADSAANREGPASERLPALALCLEALSKAKQQLLRRLYGGNETMREMALGEGVSHASMRQQIVRIRRSLRTCIEQRLKSDEV